jgi:hypothetical protein
MSFRFALRSAHRSATSRAALHGSSGNRWAMRRHIATATSRCFLADMEPYSAWKCS